MTITYAPGQNIPVVYQDDYTLQVEGDLTNVDLYIGVPYAQKVTISPQFLRKQGINGGSVAETVGRVQYKRGTVTFENTGYFRAEVTPLHRTPYKKEFSPYGVQESEVDTIELASGTQSFLLPGKNTDTEVTLINDSPLPSTFVSLAIDAEFNKKGRSL